MPFAIANELTWVKENSQLFTIVIAAAGFLVQTFFARRRLKEQVKSTQIIIDRLITEIGTMNRTQLGDSKMAYPEVVAVLQACQISGISDDSEDTIIDLALEHIEDPAEREKVFESMPGLKARLEKRLEYS